MMAVELNAERTEAVLGMEVSTVQVVDDFVKALPEALREYVGAAMTRLVVDGSGTREEREELYRMTDTGGEWGHVLRLFRLCVLDLWAMRGTGEPIERAEGANA